MNIIKKTDGPITIDKLPAKMVGEEFLELIENEFGITPREQVQSGSMTAVKELSFKETSQVIQLAGHFIYEGDTAMVYSSKGCGKSLVSLDMAYSLALGRDLFGTYKQKAREVLVIEGEMGSVKFRQRKRQVHEYYGLSPEDPDPIYSIVGRFNFYKDKNRHELMAEILRLKSEEDVDLDLIIFDNLTSMCGGVDHPKGWDAFYDFVCELKEKYNIAVLIIFHSNDDDEVKGCKMKALNCDTVLFLENLDDVDDEQ
jgi:RecA-family ATPase